MIPLDLLHLTDEEKLIDERGKVAQELHDKYQDLGRARAKEASTKAEAYIKSMESSTSGRERSAQFEARNITYVRMEDEGMIQALELRMRLIEHCIADKREAALQKVLHG